jgi:hypothetical protein
VPAILACSAVAACVPALTCPNHKENTMSISLIVLILLILLLVGALPSWGYSRNWGYGPSGGLGLVVLIVLVLLLMGRI